MKIVAITFLITAFAVICAADPMFVSSDPNGGWPDDGYYIHNNMWNSAKYKPCTSTLYAWSHDNWQVVARMNNQSGDGAVKTYPNVHRDYASEPIGAFDSMTSTFAETSPHVGIYNFAYDIWVNGIAKPGCTEIMIWNENFRQVPGGDYVESVAFDGRTLQNIPGPQIRLHRLRGDDQLHLGNFESPRYHEMDHRQRLALQQGHLEPGLLWRRNRFDRRCRCNLPSYGLFDRHKVKAKG